MTHEEKARETAGELMLLLAGEERAAKRLSIIAAALAEAEERGRAAGWAQSKEAAAEVVGNARAGVIDTDLRSIAAGIRALPDPPAAAPAPAVVPESADPTPRRHARPFPAPGIAPAVDPAVLERARQWAVEWPEGTATGDLARALVTLAERQSQTRIDQAVLERARLCLAGVPDFARGWPEPIERSFARAVVTLAGGSHG